MSEAPEPEKPRLSWLLRYRIPLLLVLLGTSGFFSYQSQFLGFDFSPQQLFETVDEDPAWTLWQETIETFGRDDLTLFVVLDIRAGDDAPSVLSDEMRAWMGALADAMAENPDVEEITSVAKMVTIRGDGVSIEVLDARELSREELAADPMLRGTLFSEDQTLAVTLLKLNREKRKVDLLRPMLEVVKTWLAENPPPKPARAHLAGIPHIRVDVADSLRADQMKFMPITLAVLLGLLGFVFRSFTRMLLPLATVGMAVVWTTGLMALTGTPIDIINNVVPSLLLVIGLSDGLHLMARAHAESREGVEPMVGLDRAVRKIASACFLTSLTSAVGFASLLASTTNILRVFGALAAFGIIVAYIVTLGVLPQTLSFTRQMMGGKPPRVVFLTRIATGLSGFCIKHPWSTLVVIGVLTLGAATVGLLRVHPNVYLTEVYGPGHPIRVLQETMDQKLGGVLPMDLLVRFPKGEAHKDPVRLAQIATLQRRVTALPGVVHSRSVADFASALHVALLGEDDVKPGDLPTNRALLAQEWLLGEMGSEPLPLSHYLAEEGRLVRIFLRTADIGGRKAKDLEAEVTRMGDAIFGKDSEVTVSLTGDAFVASRNMTALIADLFRSLALASGFIFVVLLLAFRSFKLALVAVWPNAFPLVFTLGAMGVWGLDLDVTNVVIFSIALGLAVDDTIHVIARFKEEVREGEDPTEAIHRAMKGTGQAIVLTSVILGAGMLVLTTSTFMLTARFGALAALTMMLALVADLALLPAILHLVFGWRGAKTR